MTHMAHPLHSGLVRLLRSDGTLVGAGFLVTPRLVCTCAHVVTHALQIPCESAHLPEQEVIVDFPFLEHVQVKARVHTWVPMELHDVEGDIAILRLLTDAPVAARPLRLLAEPHVGNESLAYGFPNAIDSMDIGQYAYGYVRHQLTNGYLQWEVSTTHGYHIQQGYSGTPVWDQQMRGVVGMIVAADLSQDTRVAFLIPNALLFQACSEIKPASISQLFAPLTDGLIGLPGSPLSSLEQFLTTYLGIPKAPVPFGGRQAQLEHLNRWLKDPTQPYGLLVEEAGRGKSALLTRWAIAVAEEQRVDVVFVPISLRFDTALKSTAISVLGARLRCVLGVTAQIPRDTESWLAEIEQYLREDRTENRPLLIVLDGADEAVGWQVGQDLRFPPALGHGVKIVVSTRASVECGPSGWAQRLNWFQGIENFSLPLLDRSHVSEVLQSMGNPLMGLVTKVDVIHELYRLSEGDPLLIRLYVDALQEKSGLVAMVTPEQLAELKPGLSAYFDQWWKDQLKHWGSSAPLKEKGVRALLNLLACALGPLSIEDLVTLMEPEAVDSWALREELLPPLARFVVGNGKEQGYTFSHPRLNYYFYEKLLQRERLEWERRFLAYGRHTLIDLKEGSYKPAQASAYIVRYYSVHLERHNANPEQVNDVICQEWQSAWEALEGTFDGFLSDLTRALKRADLMFTEAKHSQDRSRTISWQCRYILIRASINSQMANIPPSLIAALVEKEVWTPVQGLASVRHILDDQRRAEALEGLAPHLPPLLLPEAWECAFTISDPESQTRILGILAPHLPPAEQATCWQATWKAALAIDDQESKSEILRTLVFHMPPASLSQAWEAALSISNQQKRIETLGILAPHMQPLEQATYWQATWEDILTISDERIQARILRALAPQLPPSLIPQAWNVALSISDQEDQIGTLGILAPYMPSSRQKVCWREIWEATVTISDERIQARILRALAPQLPPSLIPQAWNVALSILDENDQSWPLRILAPYLPSSLLHEAWEAALSISDERSLSWALRALAPYLPSSLLHEAWEAALSIFHMSNQAWALLALATRMSSPDQAIFWQEALDVTLSVSDEWDRAEILGELIPHLPPSLLPRVWKATLSISNLDSQSEILGVLIPHIPSYMLSQALTDTLAIFNEASQTEILGTLAPHLPSSLASQALEATLTIRDGESRVKILGALAPQLLPLLLPQALESALAISDQESRSNALGALAPYLSHSWQEHNWQEVWETMQSISNKWNRTEILEALAPYLPSSLLPQALEATLAISYKNDLVKILEILAPNLSPSLLLHTLENIFFISNQEILPNALSAITPYLSPSLLSQAWKTALTIPDQESQAEILDLLAPYLPISLLNQAWETTRFISDEWDRTTKLGILAPHMPSSKQEMCWQEVYRAMLTISDEDSRVDLLETLGPHLPSSLITQVWDATLSIPDEWDRARILSALAPHMPLPEQEMCWQEAWETMLTISSEDGRVDLLKAFGPHLPPFLVPQAWNVTLSISDHKSRNNILSTLAPRLPSSLVPQVLETALAISNKDNRTEILSVIVPQLPPSLIPQVWEVVLAVSNEDNRTEILSVIAPQLPPSLIPQVWEVVLAISSEWSRTDILGALAPQLPSSLISQAWKVTLAISDHKSRAKILGILAPQLPTSQQSMGWQEAWEATLAIPDERSRASVLSVLAQQQIKYLPHSQLYAIWKNYLNRSMTHTRSDILSDISAPLPLLLELGGDDAMLAIAEAIIEVGKWFP